MKTPSVSALSLVAAVIAAIAFLAPAAAAAPAFTAPATYAVGTAPHGVAVADLDEDGVADIVTVNRFSGDITILHGNGDGTFSQSASTLALPYPYDIAVGDVNGDGHVDLVAALEAPTDRHPIVVADGHGDGTFEPPAAVPIVSDTGRAVAIGDVNGDGKPDIAANVLAYGSRSEIDVAVNRGSSFELASTNPLATDTSARVVLADANGDGRLDFETTTGAGGSVQAMLGKGDGTFENHWAGDVSGYTDALVAGDWNGDGAKDLAVVDPVAGTVTSLANDGSGTFSLAGSYGVGSFPIGIAAADFDGDNALDLVTTNELSSTISILPGAGNGAFGPATTLSGDYGPFAVVATDLNRDGAPDVVVANYLANTVSVFLDTAGRDSIPPTVTVPSDIVVDATSPAGAVVEYSVSVQDNRPGAAVSCTPVSGATFPIGTTTVTCTAVDAAGNTASGGFHVTVRGAAEQLVALAAAKDAMGLPSGTATSLDAKLNAARTALAAGDTATACTAMKDFLNELAAQTGIHVPKDQANDLLNRARRIRNVLGC
jgi:hypothetical protein